MLKHMIMCSLIPLSSVTLCMEGAKASAQVVSEADSKVVVVGGSIAGALVGSIAGAQGN